MNCLLPFSKIFYCIMLKNTHDYLCCINLMFVVFSFFEQKIILQDTPLVKGIVLVGPLLQPDPKVATPLKVC